MKRDEMANNYVMKVSANGQVSIPAKARERWGARRMLVVDLGDRIVMRPLPDDALGTLRGKYSKRLAPTDQIRNQTRLDDEAQDLVR